MSNRTVLAALSTLIAAASLTSTGCVGLTAGPDLGPLAIPIPVSPYFQKRAEDNFWNHERYERAPILGPIIPGGPAIALDPPRAAAVVRAWDNANPVQGGLPFINTCTC